MSTAGAAVLPRPGSPRAWLIAARPATLPAAVAPVVVGTAVAHAEGGVVAGPALAALVGALLLQIAANLANDVYDFERGADNEGRIGPVRAAQAGLLSPRALRGGLVLVLGAALLVGLYLTFVGGWPVVAIGIASMIAAVAYTGGPAPLAYHGLGDVFVMAFFGFAAVCGTALVQLGRVPEIAWWAAVPVGALATGILVVNNLRDRVGDEQAGKRTLAVRLGAGGARAEYTLLLALAYAIPVHLALRSDDALLALPLVTFPLAVLRLTAVIRRDGPALNPELKATAQLLVVHAAMLAIGLALAGGGRGGT
jgi:1,4-dihydroxy-2-naphthoate octaprenyltransferase